MVSHPTISTNSLDRSSMFALVDRSVFEEYYSLQWNITCFV